MAECEAALVKKCQVFARKTALMFPQVTLTQSEPGHNAVHSSQSRSGSSARRPIILHLLPEQKAKTHIQQSAESSTSGSVNTEQSVGDILPQAAAAV